MSIILTIQPYDDIQNFLDIIEENGGGILNLNPTDVYYPTSDINIPSNCVLNGNGGIIDFDNQEYGIKMIGTAMDKITNSSLSKITIKNCNGIGVECEYTDNPILDLFDNTLIESCETGIQLTNSTAPVFIGTFSGDGTNGILDTVTSFEFRFSEFSDATSGDGVTMTNCSSSTVFDSGFDENSGNGLTMTGCSYITFVSCSIYGNGTDGVKLVEDNISIIFNGSNIAGNTANGVNIVDNTNETNLIVSNTFDTNGTAVTDNGTGTIIRSNQGVADSP